MLEKGINNRNTRLYSIWHNMKSRCNNTNHTCYSNYGGRGINVCEEWSKFLPFKKWAVSAGYNDTLTLDRIDNDKGYNPDNCRWATIKEQANNRRNNIIIEINGEKKTITEWGEKNKINPLTIRNRILNGWTPEAAITKKPKRNIENIIVEFNKKTMTLKEASILFGFSIK